MIQEFENENNIVELCGVVVQSPMTIHENPITKEALNLFILNVSRESGVIDSIPITYIQNGEPEFTIEEGMHLFVKGEFRSFNKIISNNPRKSKLELSVRAYSFNKVDNEPSNKITIEGFLCKAPNFRETPMHKNITDLIVAVNRSYCNKSDYLPCIAWGKLANSTKNLAIGTKVRIEGRIQSRIYTKTLEDGTMASKVAYELSVSKLDVIEPKEE